MTELTTQDFKSQNRAPVKRLRNWLSLADSIVATVHGRNPITFVLGAGASRSSGAPSTQEVEDLWLEAHASLFANRTSLREGIADLNHAQKVNPILELFEPVRPFIGYHCLASLARERQIFVLNLNWDDALEQACMALGVRHEWLTVSPAGSLLEGTKGATKRLKEGQAGVYSLHVHGRLDIRDELDDDESEIRFGIYETLEFKHDVKALIEQQFFAHPTIVVGASLKGDYDVIDLLRTLTENSPGLPKQLSPFYIFSRQEQRAGTPSDGLMQNVLFSRKSAPNFRGDPAVDFDRLLLDLATRLKGLELGSTIDQGRPTIMPRLEDIAIPSKKVMGHQCDHDERHAVVIEGDARTGKTDAALLLGHLSAICDKVRPTITRYQGPKPCRDALQAFLKAKRTENPNRILILEDPFGKTGAFDANEGFQEALKRYLADRPKDPRRAKTWTQVVITTRASSWRKATARRELGPLSLRSIPVTDWYRDDELGDYLQTKVENDAHIRREIHKRELATPAAIQEALSDTDGERRAMVAEKVALLESLDHKTAWFIVRARLQELWQGGVADLPLHNPTEDPDSTCFEQARLMLRRKKTQEDSEHTYLVPAHTADREAIDSYYGDSIDKFADDLAKLERARGSARMACKIWSAVRELRKGDIEPMRGLPPEILLDWGPMFIDEAARTGTKLEARALAISIFEALGQLEHTFWSLRELVFELVRLWPLLRTEEEARKLLDAVLADDNRKGRYLVLEAMLYVQAATYPDTWDLSAYAEVWDKLAAARHRLLESPECHFRELALMFDAFTWCPPRLGPSELARWIDPLVSAASKFSPLATAIQFSSFYHPHGYEELQGKGIHSLHIPFSGHALSESDADAAVFMIRWHFVHQSRVRAMLYRRDMEPAHAYLTHRVSSAGARALTPEVAESCERMVRSLAESDDHAGWAIHLAMSVAATRTGFEPACCAAAISGRPVGDKGILTAVLTYEIPPSLVAPLTDYFSRKENEGALLEALGDPPEVEGVVVGPPPFCAARRPHEVHEILDVSWKPLIEDGIPVGSEYEFLRMLFGAAADVSALEGEDRISEVSLDKAVAISAAGDLRPLSRVLGRGTSESELEPLTPLQSLTLRLQDAARRFDDEGEQA